MLLVPTFVDRSPIHGLGLFAREPIAAGTVVWRWHPALDPVIPAEIVAALPPVARAYLDTYGYRPPDLPGGVSVNLDDARFMNHGDDPTLAVEGEVCIARRAIAAGEELTCDYGAFDPRQAAALRGK